MTRVLMVVPTLGQRPDWLRECLFSIRDQTVQVDLRVVAPSSADVSGVCRDFAADLVICDEPGLSHAINVGFEVDRLTEVPGQDYCAWLADDDRLAPGSLSATVAALDADPTAASAYGWCQFIEAHGEPRYILRPTRLGGWYSRYGTNLIPQPGSLIRYKALLAVGGLDETYKQAMDYDLFLRLQEFSTGGSRRGRLAYVPQVLASFRVHETSITEQNGPGPESELARYSSANRVGDRRYRFARKLTSAGVDRVTLRALRHIPDWLAS